MCCIDTVPVFPTSIIRAVHLLVFPLEENNIAGFRGEMIFSQSLQMKDHVINPYISPLREDNIRSLEFGVFLLREKTNIAGF